VELHAIPLPAIARVSPYYHINLPPCPSLSPQALLYGPTAAQGSSAVSQWHLVWVGLAAGVCGSAVDSLLGGAVQATYLHVASGKVSCDLPHGARLVSGAAAASLMSEATLSDAGAPEKHTSADSGVRRRGAGSRDDAAGGDAGSSGGAGPAAGAGAGETYVQVGGLAWLSNEGVNLVSAAITAAAAAVGWGL